MVCANKFVPYTMIKHEWFVPTPIGEKCTEVIEAIHFTHSVRDLIDVLHVFVTFAAILAGN